MERTALWSVVVIGLLMTASGVAGVAAGEDSAAAGWWLIVVGAAIATVGIVLIGRRGVVQER